jgi:hypothetical protein
VIGLTIAAVGWVCLAVGLVLVLGVWPLVPVGALTCAAGLAFDWEAVRRGKRS